MPPARPWYLGALAAALSCAACGGGGSGGEDPAPSVPEETRAHDSRSYTLPDPPETGFNAMSASSLDRIDVSTTSRWAGVLAGAAYRIEVPQQWNGILVMHAHGYAGEGAELEVQNPSIRRHLINNGFAWAASSYSRNHYDVRAGIEDTNALALAFTSIAAANGRSLAAPSRRYIMGHSMGGHIAAAAVEAETQQYAVHKVRYDGALPMCGVVGGSELFNRFAGVQIAAQALAGFPSYPIDKWSEISQRVTRALFTSFPSAAAPDDPIAPTSTGARFVSVLRNLTGGERPLFDVGLAIGGSFASMYGSFGDDGTVDGILNRSLLDTRGYTYVIDGDAAASQALNEQALVLTPEPDANRLRRDGLRWIPEVAGDFDVPVVSIHTLGDLFVPFSMQQVYARRAAANGNADKLVQRAIRGASHCDFTTAEQVAAFQALVSWERDGQKPAGDDVLTPATVASPRYGCSFTINGFSAEESALTRALRPQVAALAPCNAI